MRLGDAVIGLLLLAVIGGAIWSARAERLACLAHGGVPTARHLVIVSVTTCVVAPVPD